MLVMSYELQSCLNLQGTLLKRTLRTTLPLRREKTRKAPVTVGQDLAANVLGHHCPALQVHVHGGHGCTLGTLQLFLCHALCCCLHVIICCLDLMSTWALTLYLISKRGSGGFFGLCGVLPACAAQAEALPKRRDALNRLIQQSVGNTKSLLDTFHALGCKITAQIPETDAPAAPW